MHYTITPGAVPIIDEVANVKKEMDAQILKGITKEELEEYRRISDKMIANIRELILNKK
jgi:DNA-binding MarR family transcriptional regulator